MKPECQKARKTKNQQQWLAKYPRYFTKPKHAERVRLWRRARKEAAQRASSESSLNASVANPRSASGSAMLQDLYALIQDSTNRKLLMVGLIAHVFDCTSEVSIAAVCRDLVAKGNAIFRASQIPPINPGGGGKPTQKQA